MQFLQELLEIKQEVSFNLLLEDLGNLKKLGMGVLINAFKQSYGKQQYGSNKGRLTATEVGSRFNRYSGIGKDSPIIDVNGTIKKWGNITRAFRDADESNPMAAAFKLNEKPVALMIVNGDEIKRAGSAIGFAWDLTKAGLSKEEQDAVLSKLEVPDNGHFRSTAGKSETDQVGTKNSYNEKNPNIRYEYGQVKQLQGLAQPVKSVAAFLEALATKGTLTMQLVGVDAAASRKRSERYRNQPIDPKELKLFKDDIKTRLAKYKNTKIETVGDIKEFIKKVFDGGLKKINFNGVAYTAVPDARYFGSTSKGGGQKGYVAYTDSTMKNLLSGKAVQMAFSADSAAGDYGSLYLEVKLAGGSLIPTKAIYKSSEGKSVTETF